MRVETGEGAAAPAMQTRKSPARWPGSISTSLSRRAQAAAALSSLTRAARRETFRDALFLCTMPCWAARMISGSAARSAVRALAWSPVAIASSTLRTKVRIRERRERLIAVRLAILRVIFFADTVLAMGILVSSGDTDGPLEAVVGQRVQVIRQW